MSPAPRRSTLFQLVTILLTMALWSCGTGTPGSPTSASPAATRALPELAQPGAAPVNAPLSWNCFTASSNGIFGSGACGAPLSRPQAVQIGALAPGAPAGLTHSVSGTTVTLTWQAPAGPDAPTSYLVEAGSSSGLSDLASFDTGNTQTTLIVTSVPAGTYFVRVRARNSSGTGPGSNEVVITVSGGPCSNVPAAPTGLTASVSGSNVTLSWTAPAGGCPAGSYRIEAGSSPGGSNLAVVPTGNTSTSFLATNVPGGTYFVRVRAQNTIGVSSPSNEVVVTVVSIQAPLIGIAAYPIAAGTGDTSSHGITISLDGRPVTTTFSIPGIPALYPRFQGPLAIGNHQIVVTMSSWDSLLIDVGSNPSGSTISVDASSFALVSSSWTLVPFSTRAACSSRVLFMGRATGSITIRFMVVLGTSASSCPATTATG